MLIKSVYLRSNYETVISVLNGKTCVEGSSFLKFHQFCFANNCQLS